MMNEATPWSDAEIRLTFNEMWPLGVVLSANDIFAYYPLRQIERMTTPPTKHESGSRTAGNNNFRAKAAEAAMS
jgi:hypothetical protein